jgi:hypothetical protein
MTPISLTRIPADAIFGIQKQQEYGKRIEIKKASCAKKFLELLKP